MNPRLAWMAFQGSRDGDLVARLPLGHIHHTYLVSSGTEPVAILQKLNKDVFREPEALIANANLIEPHLTTNIGSLVATRIYTREQGPCLIDPLGDYWRAFEYFQRSRNLESPECESQCFSAGEAIGLFQRALVGVRKEALMPCIEGFQDLRAVERGFTRAWRTDTLGRAKESQPIARSIASLRKKVPPLSGAMGVVHGDGKFNNLLFDETEDKVVAILDLDTVMWHRRALDFGDLARAGSVLGSEEDCDAELHIGRVRAFAEGFRHAVGDLVPGTHSLADALLHVTYMLALRFYTDHLNGDLYFQIRESGDNLRRARGQFALFEQCLRRENEIRAAVAS